MGIRPNFNTENAFKKCKCNYRFYSIKMYIEVLKLHRNLKKSCYRNYRLSFQKRRFNIIKNTLEKFLFLN